MQEKVTKSERDFSERRRRRIVRCCLKREYGQEGRVWREKILKTRKRAYGDTNIVGRRVEFLRKERGISQKDFISRMQTMGCDINPTSYSKLEGQVRIATDKEIFVIAQILEISVDDLFEDQAI